MSAIGTKRTWQSRCVVSAFGGKQTGAGSVQSYPLEMGISRDVASREQGQGSKGEAATQHSEVVLEG